MANVSILYAVNLQVRLFELDYLYLIKLVDQGLYQYLKPIYTKITPTKS